MLILEQVLPQLQQQLRGQSLRQGPVEAQLWGPARARAYAQLWNRATGLICAQAGTWVGVQVEVQVEVQVQDRARAQVYVDA